MVLVGSYFAGAFICLCSIIVLVVIYYRDKKRKIIWFIVNNFNIHINYFFNESRYILNKILSTIN